MLEVRDLTAGYGGMDVLRDVTLTVHEGEIVTLIGANGAGKSTLVRVLSGLLPVSSGTVVFHGAALDRLSAAERVAAGIAQVPEGRQVFPSLSVAENLSLGAYAHRRTLSRGQIAERIREVCERFPVLLERLDSPAGHLSGGQQQMLAIARGLMAQPRLLILDEPSLGLSPSFVGEIFRMIAGLREQGLSILLSEQNARLSLAVADRGYVLENGRIVAEGSGRELLDSSDIAARYLGGGAAAGMRGCDDAMAARLARLMA